MCIDREESFAVAKWIDKDIPTGNSETEFRFEFLNFDCDKIICHIPHGKHCGESVLEMQKFINGTGKWKVYNTYHDFNEVCIYCKKA